MIIYFLNFYNIIYSRVNYSRVNNIEFIVREKELKNRYNSKDKEFGIIYGKRQIEKSSLINEFFKDKN